MSLLRPHAEGDLLALALANAWLNSPPLSPEDLRGRVVLVDFWTLSCINWLRTLPYVRAWAERYRDHGLVTIGVHTPEFAFEGDVDAVRKTAQEMRIDYPIAIDSDYAVWNGFGNHYWPALYLIDAHGKRRHHQFGEGDYAKSETAIQHLLAEAGSVGIGEDLVSVDASGVEAAADWASLKSPETYVGYQRAENFASPGGVVADIRRLYAAPEGLRRNWWGLSGEWTVEEHAARLHEPEGQITFRFHARDLHLVMGPATRGEPVRFRVLIDGERPGDAHGIDVDDDGYGVTTESRLHQLIRQPSRVTDRTVEITFFDGGVQAYVFTFG